LVHRDPEVSNMTGHKTQVGFVGLGHMGGNMAERLLTAGYPMHGYDRYRAGAEHLIEQGLVWCDSPRAVAERADVVMTSLPDDQVVEAVAEGADGLLAGFKPGAIWIDLSTVSPEASRKVARTVSAHGATMVDAPVSGSVPQVQSGTLTIMVGGDEAAYRRVEPILRELGTPTHIGGNGEGLALKLAINISLAVQMGAFAEGLLLATRSGVDPQRALEVMESSAIGSPMLRARSSLILHPPEEAWFSLAFMRKDIELALATAKQLGIPLPTAEKIDELLATAVSRCHAQDDLAALYEVLTEVAGSERAHAG
jgi:3-hydroxyisobutyrate dehydrogenase-like beta-hydroxyacid dehydrogenase